MSGVPQRFSNRKVSKWYAALLLAAGLWAVFNCAYVYLVLEGTRTYRIESSVLLFVVFLVPAALTRTRDERGVELAPSTLWIFAGVTLAMWLAIMAPLVTFPFLSDDYVFLGRYRRWSDVWLSSVHFRPLFAVVFWIVARLGGGSTVPFHVLALVLHVGCAALGGVLAGRILRNQTAGFVSFALFLTSPLQLEATLWISGLQELLCAFFVLAGAVSYSRGEPTMWKALGAAPLIVLALLSKETAIGYLLSFRSWTLGSDESNGCHRPLLGTRSLPGSPSRI